MYSSARQWFNKRENCLACALAQALQSMAQQPDESNSITRTLFVGLAMVESSAIYCFVISLILIFANPFWGAVSGG